MRRFAYSLTGSRDDGDDIVQAACERALEHHVSLHDVLEMVREFRRNDSETPVVLMGYLNPIEAMGYGDFAAAAAAALGNQILNLQWPSVPQQNIEAGNGTIGLVLQYGDKIVNVPLLQIPPPSP